jgi:Bacterial Ig-like domain (group 2)
VRSLLYFAALAAIVSVASCGEKLEEPSPLPEIQSITLTPPSATIMVGQSLTLNLSIVAPAEVARTVTWTTSSAAVATVDGSGVVTGRSPGTVTVIATSTVDATKAAAAVVTVVAPTPTFANATFNISATKTTDTGCNFSNSFTGQLQASGDSNGSNVTIRLIERLTRLYLGAVQPSGAFAATGNGDLNGFVYTGTISGQATATTVQGVETLNFSSGCPGRQVVYQFTGTIQ